MQPDPNDELKRLRAALDYAVADNERTPFGHPNFYAPISQMLRDAAKDADCHAYTDELLFAANEIEWLHAAGDEMADAATRQQWSRLDVAVAAWQEARRER